MSAASPDVFRHNPLAERNRRRKAVLLAVVLRQEDCEAVPDGPKTRGRLCRAAGVARASEETWQQAMRALRWQDWVAATCPSAPPWWDEFG